MKIKRIYSKTTIDFNESIEGETIEQKIERIVVSGEAITDGANIIHTERKEGVLPQYDIRTDKWDIAIEAMDIGSKQIVKNRMQKAEDETKKDGEAEPIRATD